MGNYRPVSNLSYVSKIIEKCVYRQVMVHLESNSLLDCYQFAYKANHSCETALVKIHCDILTLLDSKLSVVLIVFDLSAAFDTVHHKLLLHKLKYHYAFDDIVLLWFESYPTARKCYVKFGCAVSHSVTVSTGVPQSSILGPLLFSLYVQEVVAIA